MQHVKKGVDFGTSDATYDDVMVTVAIPQMGDAVAPRFEVAGTFVLATLDETGIAGKETVACSGPEGYRRVRMLQIHRVRILICNGIKASYRDMLAASGVTVIPKVSASVHEALELFLQGKLEPWERFTDERDEVCSMSHEELVDHARSLFIEYGYDVKAGPGPDAFLIDLVAELSCPICKNPVRVAVCCGAHTYRANQEITEFHHATLSNYNARVYVCPGTPSISKCCQEYGIELVDPLGKQPPAEARAANVIPLLRGPIANHERVTPGETGK